MNNKLDLHGIKHENVQRELDQFFWQFIDVKSDTRHGGQLD